MVEHSSQRWVRTRDGNRDWESALNSQECWVTRRHLDRSADRDNNSSVLRLGEISDQLSRLDYFQLFSCMITPRPAVSSLGLLVVMVVASWLTLICAWCWTIIKTITTNYTTIMITSDTRLAALVTPACFTFSGKLNKNLKLWNLYFELLSLLVILWVARVWGLASIVFPLRPEPINVGSGANCVALHCPA